MMKSALLTVLSASLIMTCAASAGQPPLHADAVIEELGKLPNGLSAGGRSDGRADPIEERRQELTRQLASLGDNALPAVARGLKSGDVSVKRNLVLALRIFELWSKFSGDGQRAIVTGLNDVLKDSDFMVRAWSAHALGAMGAVAVPAVPSLLLLLREPDVSMRYEVCEALAKIGPRATEALPELRRLILNDPDARVRKVAQQALDSIDK